MFSDLAINNAWASVGGIGGWNDADMLEVGNKGLTIPKVLSSTVGVVKAKKVYGQKTFLVGRSCYLSVDPT